MYKSPIEVIYGQVKTQMEGDIFKAVQNYGINVDKDELIKSLAYDRNQYEAGFKDASANIVRCKECRHLMFSDMYGECGRGYFGIVSPNDYCSRGERKDGAK